MRLRLNTTLRAALIAAITAVGFTLTQAQAKVSTLTAQNAAGWAVLDEEKGWEYSSSFSGDLSTSTEFQITSGGTPISFTAENSSKSYGTYTFAVTLDLTKLSVDSDTILLRGGGLSGIGVQNSSKKLTETWTATNPTWGVQNYVLDPSAGTVTIVHTLGSGGGYVAVYSEDGTTVKFARAGAGGLRGSGDLVQTFYASQSLVNAATAIAVWETNGTMDATQMQNAAKAMVDFPLNPPTDYTWAATGESATWDITSTVWNTSEKTGTNYVSAVTSSAIFNEGELAKDVTVSGAIKADKVNVNDDGYKFTVGSENSLTIGTLTVANGKTATVAGAGSITLNSLTGALVIEAGATVNMPGTVTLDATHPLPVSGEGTFGVTTLKVAGGTHNITNSLVVTGGDNGEGGTNNKLGLVFSAANGTLNLNAGTTTVTGAVYSNQGGTTINIGTGEKEATLVARRIELSDGGSSALHIGAKGKVVITSTNDTNGSTGAYKTTGLLLSEWVGGTTANIEGKLYAQSVSMYTGDAGMTLNVNNGGVVAVKGIATNFASSGHTSSSTINLAEGGKIVLGASGMVDCTIAPWTINLNGGEIGITEDATIARALNVAGAVTFNTAKYTWDGSGASLELKDGEVGGTMTVSGSLTGSGTITKTGAGELILSGAANAISNTIALQAGTLTLSGAFALDALEVKGGSTSYIGGEGIADGSGFKQASGTIDVVNVGTGATLNIDQAATFTYNSSAVTVDATTGDVSLSGTPDYTSLWINGATTVSYTAAQTIADEHSATVGTVHLNADGATVTMDKADAAVALVLTEGISGTVNATAATTISSLTGPTSGKTLTIGGSSEVTISGGNAAFASNVTIVGGTVKIGDQKSLGEHNNGVSQAKTITIAEGGTLDLNGIGDANYTYTMAGGKLTNTGNALSTNLSQTVGMTLTANSSVEALADKQFWLRARGSNATTLDLDGNTLVKTGAGMFGVYKSTVSTGTIEVRGGVFKFESGGTTAADVILNGGTIAGALNMAGNITVTAKESTTTDATFSIGTDKTLKLATDEGEKLTFSNGLSVAAGTAEIAGTVNVNSKSLDLSSGGNSTGKVKVDDGGTLNVSSSMWMGKNSSGVELAEGGILNLANLNIVGKTGGGSVTTTADNELYNTEKAAFAINKATVTATGDVIIGNTLSGVDVVTGEHEVTLNSNADSVTVSGNGKFSLGDSVEVANGITVEDGGTIVYGVDAQDVTIEAKGTAMFEQGVADVTSGVYFQNEDDVPVTVENIGDQKLQYGVDKENAKVSADELLLFMAENDVEVKNHVVVDTVTNFGDGGNLTLIHVDTGALQNIAATTGDVTLQNVDVDPIVLSSISIGQEQTVAAYTEGLASNEGTITIQDTLNAGKDGILLANLTMADLNQDGVLLLNVNGGNDNALTLGSAFNIEGETLVNLDQATLNAIASMTEGSEVVLIKALQEDGHALSSNMADGSLASLYFNLAAAGNADYTMVVNANEIAIKKAGSVPEPTTGTLSLLALMALAARRRRK